MYRTLLNESEIIADVGFIDYLTVNEELDLLNAIVNLGDVNIAGNVGIVGNLNLTGGLTMTGDLDITGDIIVSGTVDGRDIAADGATLDALTDLVVSPSINNNVPVFDGVVGALKDSSTLNYDPTAKKLTVGDATGLVESTTLSTNTINEKTSGYGVSIDGIHIRDNTIASVGYFDNIVFQVSNLSGIAQLTAVGATDFSAPFSCGLVWTGTQSISGFATFTTGTPSVFYDTTRTTSSRMADTANDRIICRKTGYYMVGGRVYYGSSSSKMHLGLNINGSYNSLVETVKDTTATDGVMCGSTTVALTSGQTVMLSIYSFSAVNFGLGSSGLTTHLWVNYIGQNFV